MPEYGFSLQVYYRGKTELRFILPDIFYTVKEFEVLRHFP